jgi:ABC-type bacteriocin/lantibiotic exporter with double-glycine peptidase domain
MSEMLNLWHVLDNRKKLQIIFLFLLIILSSLAEFVSVGLIIPFLGLVTSPAIYLEKLYIKDFVRVAGITDTQQLIWAIAIIFIFAIIISAIIRIIVLWAQVKIAHGVAGELANKLYLVSLSQPYAEQIEQKSGNIISAISTQINFAIFSTLLPFMMIFSAIFMIIGILSILIYAAPMVTAEVVMIIGFIYAIVVIFVKGILSREGEVVKRGAPQSIKILQEGLGGIRDVIIESSESVYSEAFRKVDSRMRKAQSTIHVIGGMPRYVIEAAGLIVIVIFATVSSKDPEYMGTFLPAIGAIGFAAQKLMPLIHQAYQGWTSIRSGNATLQEILKSIKRPIRDAKKENIVELLEFSSSIKLTNVFFKYRREEKNILRGINVVIQKGSIVGIIGGSGEGKSTLLDIMMGLLEPRDGFLEIDGKIINQSNSQLYYRLISHVPQAIFLSDNSIAENIAFGVSLEKIDFLKIETICKQLELHEFITNLPDGYLTQVGERGSSLSGGQKQRIGIARALYKGAKVLFLDEATSALDKETENNVMKSIYAWKKNGLTMVIVAHRESALASCDVTYKLANGYLQKIQNDKQEI